MSEKLKKIIDVAPETAHVEPWTSLPDGGIIFVKHPNDAEIVEIAGMAVTEISPSVAPLAVVQAVYKHNKDSFWGIYQASDSSRSDVRFIGYYGFLHLTQTGREALERNEFDTRDVDLRLLVPYGERPAAIYVWALVARKVARLSTPLVAWALGAKVYGGVPIYATAGTLGGLSSIKQNGFSGARPADVGLGHLFRLDPSPRKPSSEAKEAS
jgi:hypothetical protein